VSGCYDPCRTGNATPADVILIFSLKTALPWPGVWMRYCTVNDTVYQRTNSTPHSNRHWNYINYNYNYGKNLYSVHTALDGSASEAKNWG